MKNSIKILLCITLSLMFAFSAIGFAATSSNVKIAGGVGSTPAEPEGIYISDVTIHAQKDVTNIDTGVVLPTNLKSTVKVSSTSASITYKITVHNKTDVTYWYLGTSAFDKSGQNNQVGVTGGIQITTRDNSAANSTSFDTSDWIPPQTERTFYATYTFNYGAQGDVSTLVNFKFGLQMSSVSDGFLKVLNDKTPDGGYSTLTDAFEQKYKEDKSTVIANLGDEKTVFDTLFGSNLTINIDGTEKPVTIMVERANVDGKAGTGDKYSTSGAPSGCEYTLYVTVEDLSTPGGKATVYAVSYTCDANGNWYQIGELYEGKCTIADYDSTNSTYEGAVNVDTWLAVPKEYAVTSDISYKVGYEQGTNYDKLNTIEQLMSTNDTEFYNKINNNSGKLLKPVCNILYVYVHQNGQYVESEYTANAQKQGYEALKAAFDRIKPYCLIANGAQEVKLQNANSLSRAELIQMMEEIQNAYDYYMALNPNK